MGNVITQIEMMKFAGMDKAVFPAGTIVTPSAKDWAKDHNIAIVVGDYTEGSTAGGEKTEFLKYTIKAVIGNMEKAGGFLKKDEMVETVIACLQKMGCRIEK